MDKLIHYVNQGTATHGVNMLYSTPSIFTDAKLSQGITWSVKTDDFMPYGASCCVALSDDYNRSVVYYL